LIDARAFDATTFSKNRQRLARPIGRAPSTMSREVAGNGGRRRYRACQADTDVLRRARRPKSAKLAVCDRLRVMVEAKLELRSSPRQIAGAIRRGTVPSVS
jgi:IS30 family transposase